MGLYATHLLPRIQERLCGSADLVPHRVKACAGLSGHVLEIGFGSGHNVPHYPPGVTRVSAVEPSDLGWRLASERLAASQVAVERSGLDGQSLPFADDVFDAALSTFTLCTVPDPSAALAEVRRVLMPGAALHFLEHGRSPDAGVLTWQQRLNPVNRRLAGGCRLEAPIEQLVADAGFTVRSLETGYAPKEPRPFGYLYEGVAVA